MGEKEYMEPASLSETVLKKDHEVVNISTSKRASVLARPEAHLQLTCHQLKYTVPLKKKLQNSSQKAKTLLNNINAIFRPGRMTAVMGASGAGKTTLLNLLAAVAQGSKGSSLDGTINVNGQTTLEHGIKMKHISGYVYQDDVLFDTMTVREALEMSATLRLPKDCQHKERIDDLLGILGLEGCQNTKIGSSLAKGISGGERKRAAIAMEMITNPAVLFLDEPTSGLDTFTAHNVVSILLELAHDQGRTIVATIHQPSSDIFHMFDDLLLLAKGSVIYHGPTSQVVPYFAHHGYDCPQYTNPADFVFMQILNDQREGSEERITKMLEKWSQSPENKALFEELEELSAGIIPENALRAKTSFATQFFYLIKRSWRNVLRNKMVAQVKIFQSIFIGLLVGIIYFDLNSKPYQAQLQDRIGSLFFLVLNQFMGSSMGVLHAFSHERPIVLREYTQGYYSLLAYYVTKVLIEVPFQILAPIICVSVSYYMIGFQPAFSKFLILIVTAILSALAGMGLGFLAGSSFPNIGIALAVLPMLLLPLMLFSGLYINSDAIPVWLRWIKDISPTYYAFNAAAKNEFTGLMLNQCPPGIPAPCSGAVALDQLGMRGGPNIWESFLILGGMDVVLLVLGFFALWILTRVQRSK